MTYFLVGLFVCGTICEFAKCLYSISIVLIIYSLFHIKILFLHFLARSHLSFHCLFFSIFAFDLLFLRLVFIFGLLFYLNGCLTLALIIVCIIILCIFRYDLNAICDNMERVNYVHTHKWFSMKRKSMMCTTHKYRMKFSSALKISQADSVCSFEYVYLYS